MWHLLWQAKICCGILLLQSPSLHDLNIRQHCNTMLSPRSPRCGKDPYEIPNCTSRDAASSLLPAKSKHQLFEHEYIPLGQGAPTL